MNLGGLEADLFRRLAFKSAPPTEVTTRLRAYLNQTQREILSQKGLSVLRRAVLTFASVASDPFAVLPTAAVRVLAIVDRTNQRRLTPWSLDDLRDADPGLSSTSSNPDCFIISNLAAATALNPTAANLSVISTSAADDSTKEVFVEATVGGVSQKTSVALNGVTGVNVGINAQDGVVQKFFLTLASGGHAAASGSVTLHEGTTGVGTQLASIPSGRSYARYTKIQLWPTPSAVVTYHADVELHIEDMVEFNDEPYLPEDFHWLLGSGALLKEFQYRQQTASYDREKAMYVNGLGDLKVFVARHLGPSSDGGRRWSQLGPYYPAGS